MPARSKKLEYPIGYSQEVVSILADRTLAKHAFYLIKYLKPGLNVIDCGCGPGALTIDIAKKVSPGKVIGIDISQNQIETAKKLSAEMKVKNVKFITGDVLSLPFSNSLFDLAHCHGLFCQLSEPKIALNEMKRVVKSGGLIAAREPDADTYLIYPQLEKMLQAMSLAISALHAIGGGDYRIGKKLKSLFYHTDFSEIITSASCDYKEPKEVLLRECRALISDWEESPWSKYLLENKLVTKNDIKEIKNSLRAFSNLDDAFFSLTWCEVVAKKR